MVKNSLTRIRHSSNHSRGADKFIAMGLIFILVTIIGGTNMMAQQPERSIYDKIVVPAAIEEVWAAWTTEAGVKSFFAPGCNIDLQVDGSYEIFFDPGAIPGQRGADSMRIMAIEPNKMFSFTWNAPLSMPNVRKQRTLVVLKFKEMEGGKTELTFFQTGWGDGEEWDAAFKYFTTAWKDVVLPRLQYRFTHGPVNWADPPKMGQE